MEVIIEKADRINNEKQKLIDLLVEGIYTINFEQYMENEDKLYYEFEKCGFIQIIPPVHKEIDLFISKAGCVRIGNDIKGKTIKPGNIIINIRCLIDSLPAIAALAVSMVKDIPILKVCSALSLWKELVKVSTIEITRNQSIVLIGLWKFRDYTKHISLEYGFNRVNFFCRSIEEKELTWEEYNRAVDDLMALHCIDMTDGIICLRESVTIEWQ